MSYDRRRRGYISRIVRLVFSGGFLVNFGLLLLTGATFGIIVLGLAFIFVGRNLPNPNALYERKTEQSTKIFDRTGEKLLFEVHGAKKRTFVPLSDIPKPIVNALISAEDDDFYNHNGIDIKGIVRSVVVNLISMRKAQGASTITQQLVKNAILSPEKTYARKLNEIILSLKIESKFTKEEILQLYFNEIPFGSTNYGVEAAAEAYFGKPARELTVSEGTTLIAMVKAPTRYMNNPDELKARRDRILDGMVTDGYLAENEAEEAKKTETPLDLVNGGIVAPHFVFFVKEQLEEKYGERIVEEGGLQVVTTIDYDFQQKAEDIVAKFVEEHAEEFKFTNASAVAIDPKNGQILSMVGSHDYFDEENSGAVNVALRPRQPGSSIKPIAYAALFEKGYTPNTVLYDVETDFPTEIGTYHPKNYDLKERGPVSIRTALQLSLNIPAVKALYLVGVENFLKFAERMGYTTLSDRSRFGLSVVLGGGEVKLLEHTNAYATLANEGVRHPSVSILKVTDSDARVLEEWKETAGETVVDENVARTVTNILTDDEARASVFGRGGKLTIPGRPVAAKTGTTNDYRDAWTMGYAPQLAVGVWAGNNNNKEMQRGAGGSTVASGIWNGIMRAYLEGKPVEQFAAPEIPVRGNPAIDGQIGNEQSVVVDKISGLLATADTPPRLRENRKYVTHHNILHYVDRENPLGGVPENPEKDPMYGVWEQGVQDWVRRKQAELGIAFRSEEPPKGFDNVHTAENRPSVSLVAGVVDDGKGGALTVSANVSGPRPVRRVEVFVGSALAGTMISAPYQATLSIPSSVSAGDVEVRVIAFDNVENEGEATARVDIPAHSNIIRITDPFIGQAIVFNGQPYKVKTELTNPASYISVSLRVTERGTPLVYAQVVDSVSSPQNAVVSLSWVPATVGEYVIEAVGMRADGSSESSGGVVVQIVTATATQ